MTPLETAVRRLFDSYGRLSDAAVHAAPDDGGAAITALFADHFVASSPKGVLSGRNDAQFRSAVPAGFDHYRKVGGKQMTVNGLKVIPLDQLHAVAEVDWDFAYVNKQGQSGHVRFTNFYFVTTVGAHPKIFGWVTPDEERAMAEHGLV